jgi:hypothetical protein
MIAFSGLGWYGVDNKQSGHTTKNNLSFSLQNSFTIGFFISFLSLGSVIVQQNPHFIGLSVSGMILIFLY